ncbi:MAG TPA: hypothetical protein DEO67_07625 [Candidatus Edwardsbacteria bacterium]|nr:hypothetical protein [Candidatus Edwardsbacteria bacterium]
MTVDGIVWVTAFPWNTRDDVLSVTRRPEPVRLSPKVSVLAPTTIFPRLRFSIPVQVMFRRITLPPVLLSSVRRPPVMPGR